MYYATTLGSARADGFAVVLLNFGEPANNDLVVPAAIEAIHNLRLPGGRGVLFHGAASLPVAMALAHAVAHLYQFVARYDPKSDKLEKLDVTVDGTTAPKAITKDGAILNWDASPDGFAPFNSTLGVSI